MAYKNEKKEDQGWNIGGTPRTGGTRQTTTGGTRQKFVKESTTAGGKTTTTTKPVGRRKPLNVSNITAEEFTEGAGRPARKSLTATKTPKKKRKGTFVGDFWKRLSDPSKYTQNWKAGARTIAGTYPTPTRTRPEKGLDIFRPGSVRIAEQIAKERKNRRGR